MYYYALNDEKHGPVTEAEILRMLESGQVTEETLVWTEGMVEWLAVKATSLAEASERKTNATESLQACAYSGERLPLSAMIEIDGHWVKADLKDEVIQCMRQGGKMPRFGAGAGFVGNLELGSLMRRAWQTLSGCWATCLMIHLTIALPIVILMQYAQSELILKPLMNKEIPSGMLPFYGVLFALSLIGLLSHGALLTCFSSQVRELPVTYMEAMAGGISNWGRIFVAMLITLFFAMVGAIALCVGMFVVITRLMLAASIAVEERLDGYDCVQKSWELTKGYGWQIFGYLILIGLMCGAPMFLTKLGMSLIINHSPGNPVTTILAHWASQGLIAGLLQIPNLYSVCFFFILYKELSAVRQLSN